MKRSLRKASWLVAVLSGLSTTHALADSARSECGFSVAARERPDTTSSCTFSQRQGFISVRIDGGREFEFFPIGDRSGNYQDQHGNAVYRQRGLGKEGQLFKLPDSYLFVFWNPSRMDCDAQELATPGQCNLLYRDLSFSVQASTGSSLNILRMKSDVLIGRETELTEKLDGTAYRAEIADVDGNGWPEVYVYVSSAGSGSYGSLVAYAVNNGKSVTPIYLQPLEQSPEALAGYMGHDEFAVVESRLVRRFPVYKLADSNIQPTGGMRQLQYRLEAGEAGWILLVDRVVEY